MRRFFAIVKLIFTSLTAVVTFFISISTANQLLIYYNIPKKIKDFLSEKVPDAKISIKPDKDDLHIIIGNSLNFTTTTKNNQDGSAEIVTEIWGYPPGKYILADAPTAKSILETIREALQTVELVSPCVASIDVVGGADGIPVREGAVYSGDLGSIYNQSYYT